MRGRIQEAVRVSKSFSNSPKQIYVYIRYVYADTRKLLSEVSLRLPSGSRSFRKDNPTLFILTLQSDLLMVFQNAKIQGAKGIILWGSSYDLNSK